MIFSFSSQQPSIYYKCTVYRRETYVDTTPTTMTSHWRAPSSLCVLYYYILFYNSVVIVRCRALFTSTSGGSPSVNFLTLRAYIPTSIVEAFSKGTSGS
jgi:hypothetical protein